MRKQSETDSFREYMQQEHGITLATHWEICDRCHGEGQHTNPSIDGNGLPQEYVDDPEFMEDYMAGNYDVRCEAGCENGKIRSLDPDRMSPAIKREWESWLQDAAESDQISKMERMMGA